MVIYPVLVSIFFFFSGSYSQIPQSSYKFISSLLFFLETAFFDEFIKFIIEQFIVLPLTVMSSCGIRLQLI